MLSFFWRGISSVFVILYTITSVGLSNVPQPKALVSPAMQPTENIPIEPEDTTIQVLQNRKEIALPLQQAFELYSKNSPQTVKFSLQTVASESDYHSTLRSKLLSNDDVGLFQISGARELLELEEYIRELKLPWIYDAYAGTLDAVSKNQKVYGVPYSLEAIGLICNREIFAEAGIVLTDIASFEDLTKAFSDLQEKIGTKDSESLMALEAVCSFPAQDMTFLGSKFAEVAVTDSFATPAETAVSKTVLFPAALQSEEFLKLLARFSNVGSSWSKLTEVSVAQQLERFANGQVAVILQDTNAYRQINEINPSMQGNTFLLPIPLQNFEQASIYVGTPSYWAIGSSVSEKSAILAEDFLTWLYTSDEGAEHFANELESVSPFRKTSKKTGIGVHNQMLSYVDVGMTLPQLHREFPSGWGKTVFAKNVQSYLTNRETTWEDVVAACSSGWQDTNAD